MTTKLEVTGMAILFAGVAFLAFTFINAYWFLTEGINVGESSNLINAFGEALAPLITTCIRVMYLGVMGWIGSILMVRGISILNSAKSQQPSTSTPHETLSEAKAAKDEQKKNSTRQE